MEHHVTRESHGHTHVSPPAHPIPTLTIFEEDWWLHAATAGQIRRIEIRWDNVLVGTLDYYVSMRRGMRKIVLPPYTRLLAPRLKAPGSKPITLLDNNTRIIREMFDQLGRFDLYSTRLPSDRELVLPFQFNQAVSTFSASFVSPAVDPAERVLAGMHQKTRNIIRRANDRLIFASHQDIDRYRRICVAGHRGKDQNDYTVLDRLWLEITARKRGTIISAMDHCNRDIAACVVIWDAATAYYWLSARTDDELGKKANPALFFQALGLAKQQGLDFDADGYGSLAAGRFLAHFGLPVTFRAVVEKRGPAYRLLKPIKDALIPSLPEL